jgi:hypothetical protein
MTDLEVYLAAHTARIDEVLGIDTYADPALDEPDPTWQCLCGFEHTLEFPPSGPCARCRLLNNRDRPAADNLTERT